MNINFNIKVYSFLLITSILFSSPLDKTTSNSEPIDKNKIPTESRVIVGEGAKVIIDSKALAKLWYDDIVLHTGARLIKSEEVKPNLSDTDVIETSQSEAVSLPTELSISKAYPNPFNPVVNISYGLPDRTDVKILIHDLNGRKIAEHSINQQSAGWHEFNWNALDQMGQSVGSGIYLMTIQANDMVKKQKITFLK